MTSRLEGADTTPQVLRRAPQDSNFSSHGRPAERTVKLGRIDTIALGQGRCYVVGTEEIAVFRQRDGRLFATQNRCPHRQGPLSEGVMGGGRVICPLHAHRFDLTSGTGSEPGECVEVYEVEEIDSEILLRLCDRRSEAPEADADREGVAHGEGLAT